MEAGTDLMRKGGLITDLNRNGRERDRSVPIYHTRRAIVVEAVDSATLVVGIVS
ncbi:hypothetical protein SESBI_25403 [Sesbania bispinosa]|nr:hypothetical protein SESBI_25403 [Sesbania bispinosa]